MRSSPVPKKKEGLSVLWSKYLQPDADLLLLFSRGRSENVSLAPVYCGRSRESLLQHLGFAFSCCVHSVVCP